jgi:hypothetical protein
MGSGLRFVTAGLFMIAAAMFTDQAMGARRGEAMIAPTIGAGVSALMFLIMLVWGIVAGIRETRDKS